ncbi:hypothetical protein RIF29_43301 [Crotalaria pallida]|uniref:Uncharacterized protein n=1 Tax=Crotalaria pallida TaxID=3830 RepID=A0AAN9DXQ8_CROPI
MRKGVVSDEMLRGVEKKRRSGDSRIGQPFELLLNPRAGKRQPGELKHLKLYKRRAARRSGGVLHPRWRESSSRKHH